MIYKSTPSLDEKYLNHSVFLTLKKYINFYDSLAFGVFGMLDRGLLGLTTHNTYVFSAIQGTLDSIRLILTSGRINDTYALLRKYDDSTITNVYINLYLENESYKKRNDKLSIDKLIIKEIDSWVKGRMELPGNC